MFSKTKQFVAIASIVVAGMAHTQTALAAPGGGNSASNGSTTSQNLANYWDFWKTYCIPSKK